MAGFRWFQAVSGSFWVVSDGFSRFQVVPIFSKYAPTKPLKAYHKQWD